MPRTVLPLLLGLTLGLAACRTSSSKPDTGVQEDCTWYADVDGDGWGDEAEQAVGSCEGLGAGWVDQAGDCEDTDASIHPGATETCDGIDEDCDGAVDVGAVDALSWYIDGDGDGYGDQDLGITACEQPEGYIADGGDCDDGDASIHPGAAERCNGQDDDCDGAIDEDILEVWYADVDADGYGNPEASLASCDPGEGWVEDASDCDDQDPSVHPGAIETCDGRDEDCDGEVDEGLSQTWYADADGDGYGEAATTVASCDPGPGWVLDTSGGVAFDCDDANSSIHPGATERCDGLDDDCDGLTDDDDPDVIDALTWYEDGDSDGYGDDSRAVMACEQPVGTAGLGGDCDDTDPAYNPGAPEMDCADPNDYNCDGYTGYSDVDGDGWAACEECDDGDAAVFPGADEYCDGVDNDCDGDVDEDDALDAGTWYADGDGDGFGDASDSLSACVAPRGYVADDSDCDDTASRVHPGAAELCDGVDQDCDGDVDEGVTTTFWADEDEDGFGDPASTTEACAAPSGFVADATDCDDGDDGVYPGAAERCDGVDQDCDGDVDEGLTSTFWADTDADGYGDPASTTEACDLPSGFVADATDCDDGDDGVHPGADEHCDGADEDCDGAVDEAAVDAPAWYDDLDGDGYGDASAVTADCTAPSDTVAIAGDCDDSDAGVNPGAAEHCDGVDEDCDGTVDDSPVDAGTWYSDADGDGYGDPTAATAACTAPAGAVVDATDCDDSAAGVNPGAAEVCDGLDDDCDGLVDDDDPSVSGVPTWYLDHDTDGYGTSAFSAIQCTAPSGYIATDGDCDDLTAAVNPGAAEVCDGLDDDCDGLVDDDDPDVGGVATWYADADGDGYGDSATSADSCAAPAGFVADANDCDDGDAGVSPAASEICGGGDEDCDGLVDDDDPGLVGGATWYLDYDGDGWGDTRVTTAACLQPSGYESISGDCDDLEPDAYPGNTEVCDGIDNDCDGAVDDDDPDIADALPWYADVDGDGYGDATAGVESCTVPTGYVADDSDCDDTDATAYPSAAEVYDRADNDCDGDVDEGLWVGDGADGDLNVYGTVDISTLCSGSRPWADATSVEVTAINGDSLTVGHTLPGIAGGDEVLLINLQGSIAAHAAVGTYEFAEVLSVSGADVVLTDAVTETYGETDNSDLTDQVILMQRVPHYADVTIYAGGLLTTGPWDGAFGGVMAFRASGTVTIEDGGAIDVSALGYAGGDTGTCDNCDAFQGESYMGLGIGDAYGGPYNETIGGYAANGGGGGANVTGGGGNYAAGATGGDSWNYGGYTAPSCGGSYGQPSLPTLFLGSGGGGVWNGGHDDPTENPGPGGAGAGILYIGCGVLVAEGADAVVAEGETTPYWAHGSWTYGAGGGAGGSVFLVAEEVDLATEAVIATGGLGESSHLRVGGDGGYGRVRIDCNTCNGHAQGSGMASTAIDDAAEPDPGYSGAPM